jgi:endogenous inhibitor of DNA gyrase (YacG/DUF329 family)
MKYSRKCLICGKEVVSSNKRTFVHPECKKISNELDEDIPDDAYMGEDDIVGALGWPAPDDF